MTEKEKIKKYLEIQGVSKNKFYQKTGLSIGFLDSGKSLGVDKMKIIIDNYPNLSINWLLFGDGPMLLSEQSSTDDPDEVSRLRERIAHLEALLEEKERLIQVLLKK